MSNEETNKVLEELHEVRPEKLNDKAKRLFEAIMTIANSRDEIEYKCKKALEDFVKLEKEKNEKIRELESDLYEANNRINDLLDTIKLKEEQIEYIENEYGRTIEQKNKIIDWLVEEIHSTVNLGEFIDNNMNKLETKEEIKKYFEERCK